MFKLISISVLLSHLLIANLAWAGHELNPNAPSFRPKSKLNPSARVFIPGTGLNPSAPVFVPRTERKEQVQAQGDSVLPTFAGPEAEAAIQIQRAYRQHRRNRAGKEYYIQTYGTSCEPIRDRNSQELANLAKFAFQAGNYQAASFFSARESEKLNVKTNGNLKYYELDEDALDGENPSLEQDDQFVYFYKSIRKSQLATIATYGLDANYGGRGGSSEKIGFDQEFISNRDRGRQFLGPSFRNSLFYAALLESNLDMYTTDLAPVFYQMSAVSDPTVMLQIKIPLQKTLDVKLTHNEGYDGDEYFIAGSTIPPEWMSSLETRRFIEDDIQTHILDAESLTKEKFNKLAKSKLIDDVARVSRIQDRITTRLKELVKKVPSEKFVPLRKTKTK